MEILSFTAACMGLCLGCAGGTAMFWLLLSCACVVSRLSPAHVFPWEWPGHDKKLGGHSWGSWPKPTRRILQAIQTSFPQQIERKGLLGRQPLLILVWYWSACGRPVSGCICITPLGFFLVLFASFIKMSLSWPMKLLFSSNSFSSPLSRECVNGCGCLAGD